MTMTASVPFNTLIWISLVAVHGLNCGSTKCLILGNCLDSVICSPGPTAAVVQLIRPSSHVLIKILPTNSAERGPDWCGNHWHHLGIAGRREHAGGLLADSSMDRAFDRSQVESLNSRKKSDQWATKWLWSSLRMSENMGLMVVLWKY